MSGLHVRANLHGTVAVVMYVQNNPNNPACGGSDWIFYYMAVHSWILLRHGKTYPVLYLYDILPIINNTDSTGEQNRWYRTNTDINCACAQSTMHLKWLLEGVLFGGSLALIPYKSTCQCVKSAIRMCLEEERTDGEWLNSNILAVLTFAYIS